jgi:hypothetical protein
VVVGRLQLHAWTTDAGTARSHRGGRGQPRWAKPAVGDGDDDQGDAQPGPVASSTDAAVRDAKRALVPHRRIHAGELREEFSTNPRPALRAAALGRQVNREPLLTRLPAVTPGPVAGVGSPVESARSCSSHRRVPRMANQSIHPVASQDTWPAPSR